MHKIRVIQAGEVLSDCVMTFCGTAVATGSVGDVPCYLCVYAGNPADPRCGLKITPRRYRGPVTVQAVDEAGKVVMTLGVATTEQVAAHATNRSAV